MGTVRCSRQSPKNVSLGPLPLPVWILGLPPVMESEHDGEGGGRQQLLVVVVVQAMSSGQGKSVANLSGGYPAKTTTFL